MSMNHYFKKVLVTLFSLSTLTLAVSPAGAEKSAEHRTDKTGWVAMSAGGSHKLAIKHDGSVWAWGSNRDGQLGTGGPDEAAMLPVQTKNLSDAVFVGTGNFNSYAILKDGTVWSWGDNTDGQVGDGTVTERQTGTGDIIVNNDRSLPFQLKGLSNVISIIGNFAASFALKEDGTVWGWGFISIPYQTTPVQLLGWTDMKMIATGYSGNLVGVKKDGTVWTHGNKGRLEQIRGIDHVIDIAVGPGFTAALKEDGTVWSWGQNHDGQLGDGSTESRGEPAQNTFIRDVKELEVTAGGPIYLKKDGTVWANGNNGGGQLGIGSYENSNIPVQVRGLTHIEHISASSTGNSVMALREDGVLWGWGDGYLGDGTKWWRTLPVQIKSDDSQLSEDVNTIKVDINGKAVSFEQFPQLVDNTTMVPMRKIFETLGAEISWDNDTSTITATKQNSVIRITIGENNAVINDHSIKLDVPAAIIDGSTFVPVRFIAESFGATVGWDDVTKTVSIATIS